MAVPRPRSDVCGGRGASERSFASFPNTEAPLAGSWGHGTGCLFFSLQSILFTMFHLIAHLNRAKQALLQSRFTDEETEAPRVVPGPCPTCPSTGCRHLPMPHVQPRVLRCTRLRRGRLSGTHRLHSCASPAADPAPCFPAVECTLQAVGVLVCFDSSSNPDTRTVLHPW